jgi:hypothetical protein
MFHRFLLALGLLCVLHPAVYARKQRVAIQPAPDGLDMVKAYDWHETLAKQHESAGNMLAAAEHAFEAFQQQSHMDVAQERAARLLAETFQHERALVIFEM